MRKIQRAIVSVHNKEGLLELAKVLLQYQIEIYSTGGTLRTLANADIPVHSIESYTGFPEMLDGRVKTLHPKIHGGLLARRDQPVHMQSLAEHKIVEFDLVILNLYPFEEVVRRDSFSFEEAVENIDIGGPAMIRSAAKNHNDVAVVTDPEQYPGLLQELEKGKGSLSYEYRFQLMLSAFARTAEYDSLIAQYLRSVQGDFLPNRFSLPVKMGQALRYGENPHQKAAFYVPSLQDTLPWKQIAGKELSYNNILDLDIAIRMAADFSGPVCIIFKHTNPCGIAAGENQPEILQKAMNADKISFFGGIVIFNRELKEESAEILSKHFFEIIIAPEFTENASEKLKAKKNLRLITVKDLSTLKQSALEIRNAAGGFLVQETDSSLFDTEAVKVVSKRQPDQQDMKELEFSFRIAKFVKSNTVVFTKDMSSLAIGAGQMSRIDSIQIAEKKAEFARFSLKDSYAASEAFFPFRDSIDTLAQAGVKAVIQPGGSIKDQDSIDAANEHNMILVFTGMRHFRH